MRAMSASAGLASAALVLAHGGPAVTALGPVRRQFFPRLAGIGRGGHVALTFDDGPDPRSTPGFLDVLASRQVRATFFLLGSMVARAPLLASEIAAAGHEIAVHGWDHRYAIGRGPWAQRDDMARARDAAGEATGAAPRFYRPPYGVLSGGALAAARGLGLTPVLWTSWGREWTPGSTPASVYQTVSSGLADGGTVLLHDSDCTSPDGSALAALGALPMVLDECERRGLRVGTLAEHGLR
jgi:peptidoglycan-N-acetylglucosamine deacetylase